MKLIKSNKAYADRLAEVVQQGESVPYSDDVFVRRLAETVHDNVLANDDFWPCIRGDVLKRKGIILSDSIVTIIEKPS